MNVDTSHQTGTLRLAVCEGADVNYLNVAAALIRELPGVRRVRVALSARQLEILYEHPTDGLLRQIHLALRAAGQEIASLKMH